MSSQVASANFSPSIANHINLLCRVDRQNHKHFGHKNVPFANMEYKKEKKNYEKEGKRENKKKRSDTALNLGP